ncbi:MAG: type II toxin-antitoxin system VapC family toxin [Planctomycetota bacterium]
MAERLVVDASVAAKWFLKDEADVDLADDLLLQMLEEKVEAFGPALLTYEVAWLLIRAHRAASAPPGTTRLSREKVFECLRKFFGIPIRIELAEEGSSVGATELSLTHVKNYYEMVYVRLAEDLGCRWCTADEKAWRGAGPTFPIERILPLADFGRG